MAFHQNKGSIDDSEVTQYDVLLGRCGRCSGAAGTIAFKAIIESRLDAYLNASSKKEKTLLTLGVILMIEEVGGRFLAKQKLKLPTLGTMQMDGGGWNELKRTTVRIRVRDVFRDCIKNVRQKKSPFKLLHRIGLTGLFHESSTFREIAEYIETNSEVKEQLYARHNQVQAKNMRDACFSVHNKKSVADSTATSRVANTWSDRVANFTTVSTASPTSYLPGGQRNADKPPLDEHRNCITKPSLVSASSSACTAESRLACFPPFQKVSNYEPDDCTHTSSSHTYVGSRTLSTKSLSSARARKGCIEADLPSTKHLLRAPQSPLDVNQKPPRYYEEVPSTITISRTLTPLGSFPYVNTKGATAYDGDEPYPRCSTTYHPQSLLSQKQCATGNDQTNNRVYNEQHRLSISALDRDRGTSSGFIDEPRKISAPSPSSFLTQISRSNHHDGKECAGNFSIDDGDDMLSDIDSSSSFLLPRNSINRNSEGCEVGSFALDDDNGDSGSLASHAELFWNDATTIYHM